MKVIIAIGCGGALGSIARYLIAHFTQKLFDISTFPIGTLIVNIIGSLIIGLLAGLSENAGVFSPAVRAFLLIGLLGGFTTFSTFAYETTTFLRDAQFLYAVLNITSQVVLGVIAAIIGYKLSIIMR